MTLRHFYNGVLFFFNLNAIVSGYENHILEIGFPCHDYPIFLGTNEKSALNFTVGNNFGQWAVLRNLECSFRVRPDVGYGVIAVIQRLRLRGNGAHCLDYVEFQTQAQKMTLSSFYQSSKRNSKKYCGFKNVSQMVALPGDNLYYLPENVYFVDGKDLNVKIYVSEVPLLPEEILDIGIVFTAVKRSDCKEKNEFDCGNNTCIWKGFHKDGLVNCPYKNCSDEEGCEGPTVKYSSGNGTTIIICAVLSMISVLAVFLLCLFVCRRCKVLCWARQPSRAAAAASSDNSRVQVSAAHLGDGIQPSAPPLISLNDKDLPPSYDSLFPARSCN